MKRAIVGILAAICVAAICVAAGLVAVSPASAQTGANRGLVIVRSNVPTLKVGQVLRPGETLRLSAGQRVDLLSARGARLSYSGPFEGGVGGQGQAEDRSRLQLIRDAIFGLDEGTQGLGGTRMPSRPEGTTDIVDPDAAVEAAPGEGPAVLIEFGSGEVWCAIDDLPVWLVRPSFGRARASLKDDETGASADLAWSFFRDTAPWPESVAIRDGGRYTVSFERGEAASLTLHRVRSSGDPSSDLVTLAERGCVAQVERVAAALGG